jgi:hypothetical protein
MSGGSHGYLGRVMGMFELLEKIGHLEDVAQRLRELGHEAAANDTQMLYDRLTAEPECFEALRKVWHAVDYLDSNDYSEDQVADAVKEYQEAWGRLWCPCCIFGNHIEKCTCDGKGCCCHSERHAIEKS